MIDARMYVCFRCIIKGLCICAFLYVWHYCHDACLSSQFQHLIYVYVHGRFAQSVLDVRRVLFAGLRDGDMTEATFILANLMLPCVVNNAFHLHEFKIYDSNHHRAV